MHHWHYFMFMVHTRGGWKIFMPTNSTSKGILNVMARDSWEYIHHHAPSSIVLHHRTSNLLACRSRISMVSCKCVALCTNLIRLQSPKLMTWAWVPGIGLVLHPASIELWLHPVCIALAMPHPFTSHRSWQARERFDLPTLSIWHLNLLWDQLVPKRCNMLCAGFTCQSSNDRCSEVQDEYRKYWREMSHCANFSPKLGQALIEG